MRARLILLVLAILLVAGFGFAVVQRPFGLDSE